MNFRGKNVANKSWTKKDIETHIKLNAKTYDSVIVVGALFKKLYGVHPTIGLSGYQASAIDAIVKRLPDELKE